MRSGEPERQVLEHTQSRKVEVSPAPPSPTAPAEPDLKPALPRGREDRGLGEVGKEEGSKDNREAQDRCVRGPVRAKGGALV